MSDYFCHLHKTSLARVADTLIWLSKCFIDWLYIYITSVNSALIAFSLNVKKNSAEDKEKGKFERWIKRVTSYLLAWVDQSFSLDLVKGRNGLALADAVPDERVSHVVERRLVVQQLRLPNKLTDDAIIHVRQERKVHLSLRQTHNRRYNGKKNATAAAFISKCVDPWRNTPKRIEDCLPAHQQQMMKWN